MTEREFALDVVRKLQHAGFAALWAGGCVRDELLGLTPADYDVATNARPEQLRPLFKRRNEIGASFGVVQVIGPRDDAGEWLTIEVATFRSDGTLHRRPAARRRRVLLARGGREAPRLHHQRHVLRPGQGTNSSTTSAAGPTSTRRSSAPSATPSARFTEDKLRILRGGAHGDAVRARHRPRDSRGGAANGQRDSRGLAGAHRRGVAEAPRSSESCARAFNCCASSSLDRADPAGTGRRWWPSGGTTAFASWRSLPSASVVSARVRGAPACDLDKQSGRGDRRPPAALRSRRRAAIAWLVEKQQYLDDAPTMRLSKLKTILVHPGIDELLALHRADAVATGTSLERGRVLRADAPRHAAGRTEPAARAHGRGPDRDGPEAGPGVQAAPRRRPRGATGGEGEDEGGGDLEIVGRLTRQGEYHPHQEQQKTPSQARGRNSQPRRRRDQPAGHERWRVPPTTMQNGEVDSHPSIASSIAGQVAVHSSVRSGEVHKRPSPNSHPMTKRPMHDRRCAIRRRRLTIRSQLQQPRESDEACIPPMHRSMMSSRPAVLSRIRSNGRTRDNEQTKMPEADQAEIAAEVQPESGHGDIQGI